MKKSLLKPKREKNGYRKEKKRAGLWASCCCSLFIALIIISTILAIILIPVLVGNRSTTIVEKTLILSQTLTQINNNQTRISVLFKNYSPDTDFNVTSITNSLLGGAEMTCIPTVPTTLVSNGGMIMCTDVYDIEFGETFLNAVVSINNGEFTETDTIQVVVFPPEICNTTFTQYGQDIIKGNQELTSGRLAAISADGSVILFSNGLNSFEPMIYEFDGLTWIPKGDQSTLLEPNFQGYFAGYFSDDGNTVAISAEITNGGNRDHIVFVKDFINGNWVQRGQIISVSNILVTKSGVSITPDGNTIALTQEPSVLLNGMTQDRQINVTSSVYDWNGIIWELRGQEQILTQYFRIASNLQTKSSYEIDISGDGNTYVVTHFSFVQADLNYNITTVVFEWNGQEWDQRGQIIENFRTFQTFFAPSGSAEISTDGNIIFNGNVYDWNGIEWVERPEPPNVREDDTDYRLDECMSYDGNYVASFDYAAFTIYEWKSVQNEWVICQNATQQFGVACPFSRDGMHFVLGTFVFSGGVSGVIKTFTFM